MESKTIKKAPKQRDASCVHGRLIEDVAGKDQKGKVRCVECGTIFDDPHRRRRDCGADNPTERREVHHAVTRAVDPLKEDGEYSVGIGRMRPEEGGLSGAFLGGDQQSSSY